MFSEREASSSRGVVCAGIIELRKWGEGACAVFRERVASSWWHRVLRPRGKVVCAQSSKLTERRLRRRNGLGVSKFAKM